MKGKGSFKKDLKSKSVKDLIKMREKLRKEEYELKSKNTMRGLKETHKIKQVRRNVARVESFLASKIKENNGSTMK